MTIPAHIWLIDDNGSPLIGECLMPSRLGSTELKSFNHSVWIPTDHNTGKLTGTRLHVPIRFEKEIDRLTPYLFRAVCEGRILKEALIKMYKINDAGIELEYFNIKLENVKITQISPVLFPVGIASKHMEEVEIRYESIEWKYTEGNIMYKDSWNERVTA
ncbi:MULTISPECIES: Hcp family type VI secretion system effector [Enterobacter]|uniref:Type VI secretion system tube protein Hcp n=1 Tax=Enterobacter quasihormaechei TaxID=2529382 RepID=A0AAE8R0P6_9ENTR|nr:type VI secretion system tube protein TssD [Enterobacter quasihormaechei]TCB89750.1 type VI secretion system tube protein Hcp [Enterobacter quasihormaechei]